MDEIYTIPEHPEYSEKIRKLRDNDPVSASTVVNPLVMRLIENITALKQLLEQLGETLGETNTRLQFVQQTAEQAAERAENLTAADVGAVAASARGAANGVASLDASGKVPAAQLPSLAPYAAGTSAPGDKTKLWIDTTANTGGLKYWNGSAWEHVPVAYT